MSHAIRFLIALILVTCGTAFAKDAATYPYHEIESWQNEGMVFVVRDASGHIITHAKGHLEHWVSETQMVWVVRDELGQFITYARGSIETWQNGTKHLVLRNSEGKFVAIAQVAAGAGTSLLSTTSEREALHVLAVF